ncbi:uncharacterized protein DNG_09729 [Cephalotrichum gorgonifer]|uniref:SnoaL-like domain-containing protein n=1 Tax=Cephalotrichum gorgonifer TaxID=2041049 RepID=A0AAE8SZL8_9PEZI|nr:uncharacterized protein DNG_09729 [Cephalotrichum gorgonifer]
MRSLTVVAALLLSPFALAAPSGTGTAVEAPSRVIAARQGIVTPEPCQRQDPPPTEEETEALFDQFVQAFITEADISEAFKYIVEDYINHNPLAQNGFANALDILGPFWGGQQLTLIRTHFEGDMSWVNYRSSFGNIVDRFRWEGGCIAEHWDQGEQFPNVAG